MKDLIERLEKATRPDRELDALIGTELGLCDHSGPAHHRPYKDWAKPYTSSIDAALTLVPEGAGLQLERYWLRRPEAAWRAVLYLGGVPGNPRRSHVGEDAFTPAIALCIAALKERLHSPAGCRDALK